VGRGAGTILHIGTTHIMCKIRQNTSIYLTRSTAFRRPWVFCDQRCIMDDF
jgi:hypothetical protein